MTDEKESETEVSADAAPEPEDQVLASDAESSDADNGDADNGDADNGDADNGELEPARYEPIDAETASFAPKLPWRALVLGAVVLIGGIGWYFYNEHRELTALREGIVGEYVQGVEPDARRLRGFRQQLEDMILEAAANPPETAVDPQLRFAAMHDARGIYLRIRAADADSREHIAAGSTRMVPDSFTRCLGLAPTSLRGLFERGDFLQESWPEQLRTANTRLRLRVIQDELRRHIRRDLPLFDELLQADYFLLTLEQDDGALDVFLWDLHHGERLLRTRARASGLLLPVRIDLPGVAPGPRYRPQPHLVGAAECSIAAHVKGLTGEDTMSFGSHLDAPTEAAESADAGTAVSGDGAVPSARVAARRGPKGLHDEAPPATRASD